MVQQTPGFRLAGLLDDDPAKIATSVLGSPVLGPIQQLQSLSRQAHISSVAFGAGDNLLRRDWFELAQKAELEAATLVHPSAVVSRHVKLGVGVVALAGVIVNAGAVISDNVCLNTGCRIDHDCELGEHSHIFPSATLTGGVKLGPYATVGAGAVVTADVGDNEVVAGNPARLLRVRSPDESLTSPSSVKVAHWKA